MKIPSRILLIAVCMFGVATVAASAQVINGCVDKNGSLRIVLAGESCKNNESPVSWNSVGPQGPVGVGTPGRDGLNGRDGKDGRDGAPGKDGTAGSSTPAVVTVGTADFGDGSVFQIKDFSFSVENLTTIGSATGGAGAGKITFNEFTIKKTTDKASAGFFLACA